MVDKLNHGLITFQQRTVWHLKRRPDALRNVAVFLSEPQSQPSEVKDQVKYLNQLSEEDKDHPHFKTT
jgi:hypothetical protein